ncbi:MAG: hypothetical protein FJ150_00635 [Euryarchaeota archaeon]|nr:hypothetical protein [Euryarchaeota archaeon]
MIKYKVNSIKDYNLFVVTESYKKLYKTLKDLKNEKGRIIHIIGAPGTGKSSNIYFALNNMDFEVYEPRFELHDQNASSKMVFNEIFKTISRDFHVRSVHEVYKKLSSFDAILFADNFHDTHFIDKNLVGFSKWTDSVGYKTFYFYLLCITEYIKHRSEYRKMNIVFQTAWRVYIGEKKYDLFSDFGFLSRIMVFFLKMFFSVAEISYSEPETINIVKKHVKNVDNDIIRRCIKKHGRKPRFICEALENR